METTEVRPNPTIHRKPVPTSTERYLSSNDTHPRTFSSRLQSRWSLLRLRTRFLIVAGLLALLALILGLSIGLSVGGHQAQNLPLPSNHGGPYSGDLTYYGPGLGACGVTSTSSEMIVSIAHSLFDAAQTGSDPNSNPLCGRKIRAKRYKENVGERSIDLTVVDRCVGCQPTDIDVSITAFGKLADPDLGRVTTQWSWLD